MPIGFIALTIFGVVVGLIQLYFIIKVILFFRRYFRASHYRNKLEAYDILQRHKKKIDLDDDFFPPW